MADVTLAECDGQVWLVTGEDFIDDLLANMLAPDVTVEIVHCATRGEVWAMWAANSQEPVDGVDPWIIHPAIVRRIKGSLAELSIQFMPWSAQLDDSAKETIGAVASRLVANAAERLTLRQFAAEGAPAGSAELQRLRSMLVTEAIGAAGADTARLDTDLVPSTDPAALDRVELAFTDGARSKPH